MSKVISGIILTNLAFNESEPREMPKKVEISTNLDDRYMVSIKFGEWEALIPKDDLRRIV